MTNTSNKLYTHLLKYSNYNTIFDSFMSSVNKTTFKQHNIKDIHNIFDTTTIDAYNSLGLLTKQNKLLNNHKFTVFPILDAQLLTNYIIEQISITNNLRAISFKSDLLNGIAKTAITILKRVKLTDLNIVSGLKVECFGR